jgi:hypothetical protein
MFQIVDKREKGEHIPIVIIQKNNTPLPAETAVVWCVIRSPEKKIAFPPDLKIGAYDSWGNRIKVKDQDDYELAARKGQLFHVIDYKGDMAIEWVDNSAAPDQIAFRNDLIRGSVNAHLERDKRPVAITFALATFEVATFCIDQSIWLGVSNEVEENETINSALLQYFTTHIDLAGMVSADIVVTDGDDVEFPLFTLANVKYLNASDKSK